MALSAGSGSDREGHTRAGKVRLPRAVPAAVAVLVAVVARAPTSADIRRRHITLVT